MLNKPCFIPEVYPYIIEADPLLEDTAYPTHTHGLYNVGLPEILMDPLSFGGEGNGQRINSAYNYFINPKNAGQLEAVLDGQIIKLPGPVLDPKYMPNDRYVYCLREVSPHFEAVRLAYGNDVAHLVPPMRFIQIWVDGDDFALTDEYYRGGVTE
ncbi:MAG: hypothetical protein HF981_01055 [Desulfobacteraceae bacterium]|nr:hypothetical protein [Desulfobacteraceae bacterium]MBC2748954.1 hypothetical protein [Desulfobacteraceae bacterium]